LCGACKIKTFALFGKEKNRQESPPSCGNHVMRDTATNSIVARVFIIFSHRRVNATMNAVKGERSMNAATSSWLTFAEAGALAGKSSSAVRMWVKRRRSKGEPVQVKKEPGKHGEIWYIHSSEVGSFGEREGVNVQGEQEFVAQGERVNTITVEYYDAQRKQWDDERDELRSGLMMYRWKYEELDRQVKLLPAPVEVLPSMVLERDAQIRALEEELAAKALPWWKRMFRR
jgi:hypothetical protein